MAIIQKDKIDSSYIVIKPLINPLEEKNKKRTYHLIINSFDANNPKLHFNEKFPTLIYFDSNLDKMILSYHINNSEEPVVFSFFIKERNRFEVKILDDEKQNRIIGYKDNIIIDPKKISVKDNNIYITTINKLDKKDCTMIVKVSGNNSPFYLQKNILNLGFIPINTHNHYYYMEVFKGEEGEIMLHNKIHNGYLSHKIIEKNIKDEKEILVNFNKYFPKYDDKEDLLFNKYNDYSKKLNFTSYETEKCENGCYLLITYYSPDINLINIDGIEYTLLARIWDEDEFKSQIINIPLNEYVFGAIEPSFYSINAHYYSIFIPEDNNIIFEFQGKNIDALLQKGIIRINVFMKSQDSFLLTDDTTGEEIHEKKLVSELNKTDLGLESFKNKYFSFAFKIKHNDFSNKFINNYYFRIIQKDSKNANIIYPLDTNKANLCQTTKYEQNNYVSYFLLKNDYKELNNNFHIHTYGLEEAYFYSIWYFNQTDFYSISINDIKEKNQNKKQSEDKAWYFKASFEESFKYALLEIHSNHDEILEVLFNFDSELIPYPSLDIYSYQTFHLKHNEMKNFSFNYDSTDKYSILVNNTSGDGYICFNQNCDNNDKKISLSGQMFLSFTITGRIHTIHFYSENELFFYLKINNIMANDIIEEINYGYNYKNINRSDYSSKAYFLKDIYEKGVDVNLYFDFNNNENIGDVEIYGFILNDDNMKNIDTLDDIKFGNKQSIDGIYDPRTKTGFISFENKLELGESNKEYIYYLFGFYYFKDSEFNYSVKIFIDSKKDSQFLFPKNEYIRGSFNLFNNDKKTFYIVFEETEKEEINISNNNTYILEFSTNTEGIIPTFNDDFNYYNEKSIGGVQQYFISTSNLEKGKKYNFTVQMNDKTNNKKLNPNFYLYLHNYILKLYKNESLPNLDFINDLDCQVKHLKSKSNIIIKNNKENYTLNYNYNYTYFTNVYLKEILFEPQILNTTAFLFYNKKFDSNNEDNSLPFFYNYKEFTYSNPYEEFSFDSESSLDNENYYVFLFIKINGNNKEEMYYSTCIEKNEKVKKEETKENKSNLWLFIIIFGSIFVMILVISLITCEIYRRKNKNLKEQVQAISFSSGIDEDNINKKQPKSKKEEEDYENSFI